MTYESRKVAIKYFVISAVFFGLQVVLGLLLAAKYVWPDPLNSSLSTRPEPSIPISLSYG